MRQSNLGMKSKVPGKKIILNSFKIAGQIPSPLSPNGDCVAFVAGRQPYPPVDCHSYLKLTPRLGPPPPSILN